MLFKKCLSIWDKTDHLDKYFLFIFFLTKPQPSSNRKPLLHDEVSGPKGAHPRPVGSLLFGWWSTDFPNPGTLWDGGSLSDFHFKCRPSTGNRTERYIKPSNLYTPRAQIGIGEDHEGGATGENQISILFFFFRFMWDGHFGYHFLWIMQVLWMCWTESQRILRG